ncbi:MAG TPA: hypothetical protein VN778_01855, partial [Verrucomicrobiae bacterium]|nr:hypothetical protein [Verrucomicrobiae bacterium]
MEKEPKRPLYVDDIRAAAENSDAIQRDIIEQAEALRQEIAANQGASYEDVHAFMYKVGIFVLKKLQEKGIDDALELEGRLEELDNLHPNRSRADMFTVASYYETTSQESGIGYEEQL